VDGSRQGGRLVVVCGLPGAGKTTHARRLCAEDNAVRFSPDEWLRKLSLDVWDEDRRTAVESLQWELAQQLLQEGMVVVVEWGTWGRAERDTLRTGARDAGARVELHYLKATPEVLYSRVSQRATEDPPITRDQLIEWHALFQEPTDDELALFDRALVLEQG